MRIYAGICALCVLLVSALPCAAQQSVTVSSSAASAILYEPLSGRVLFEHNARVKRPMASTTKLMTALIAVETLASDARLTASAEALQVIGSSMGLRVGDTLSRDDALKGLLLASGNDVANVIALSIDGSYEAFAKRMNARAAALGMTNTQFVTPSGLDADGHGSTAYDMALLGAAVLKNDTLAAICRMPSAQITVSDREVTLQNHNKLLTMYPDCVGLKTGFTSLAGRCLVSAAEKNGVTLIAVTLDCANDWAEHQTLFDEGFALMTAVKKAALSPRSIAVYGGENRRVAVSAPETVLVVPSMDVDAIETAIVLPPYVWAPVKKGDPVGAVVYSLRGATLASVPIIACETVEQQPRTTSFQRIILLFRQLLVEAIL